MNDVEADAARCPKCGHYDGRNHAHARQGVTEWHGLLANVVDVGWKCPACGHEWGFEVLTNETD